MTTRLFLPVAVLSCAISIARGTVIHVSPGSTGGDGRSWSMASSNLVEVVRSAAAGDVVWVAAGDYSGNLQIPPGVTVLGGFRGDETTAVLRNPRRNATRFQLALNATPTVQFLSGSEPATLEGFRLVGRRGAGSVVTATNAAPRLVDIDLIHPGRAPGVLDGSSRPTWNFVGCDVRIRGCQLVAASYTDTAVIQMTGGNGAIEGCHIASNSVLPAANEPQSGVVVVDGASPRIERNWFSGNSAHHGAGVTVLGTATPVIRNNLFTDQSSNGGQFGNIADLQGGSALFVDVTAAPRFIHNTVTTRFGVAVRLLGTNGVVANNLFAFGNLGPQVTGIGPLLRNGWVGPSSTHAAEPVPLDGVGGNLALFAPFAGEPNRGHAFLLPGSAAVDSGVALADAGETDFMGNPRSLGNGPDLGAFESRGMDPVLPSVPVFRVRTDGDDLNDGSTWMTAKRTIGAALDEAVRVGGEVWVATGTYREPTLFLGYLVSLHGGFEGNEAHLPLRNPRRNQTTLDGGGANQIAMQLDSAFTGGTGMALQELSGFTFKNGLGRSGGALSAGALRISENRFESNRAVSGNQIATLDSPAGGGAVVLWSRSAEVVGNVFLNNSATVTNRRASDYRFGMGGAVLVAEAGTLIRDNLFQGNSADTRSSGDAIGLHAARDTTRIANSSFLENLTPVDASSSSVSNKAAVHVTRNPRNPPLGSDVAVRLRNNLFAFNSGVVTRDVVGVVPNIFTAYNAVFHNDNDSVPAGESNRVVNPGFAGPGSYPRHVATSPLRDAGDPATDATGRFDLDGRTRQIGGRVDIGAFEFDAVVAVDPTQVVRVAADGDDAHDGTTWKTAKRAIQSAVTSLGTAGGEVWVRGGAYRGPITTGEFVSLYGGFLGTETRREERDWAANPTVIGAPLPTDATGGPLLTLNSRAGGTVVSGFRIQGGIGRPVGGVSVRGGGVLSENIFSGNRGTNGMFDPHSLSVAGAVLAYGPGLLRIENNLFLSNSISGSFSPLPGAPILNAEFPAQVEFVHNTAYRNSRTSARSILRFGSTNNLAANNVLIITSEAADGLQGPLALASSNMVSQGSVSTIEVAGQIRGDPLLINPAGGDFRPMEASPARDAADGRFRPIGDRDLAGRLRMDGRADIGAFEYFPPPPADFAVAIDVPSAGASITALRATDVFHSIDNTNRTSVRSVLLVDGIPVATNTVAGFRVIRWSAPLVGNHALVIRVWVDGFQPTDSAPVNVIVPVPAGDTPPVFGAITVSARGGVLVAPVTVSVNASISDTGGIQGSWRWTDAAGRLLRSGLALGSATTGPMEFLQAGTHTFRLWVQDRVGQTTETNVTVRIESPTRWTSNFGPDLVLRALNEAGVVAGSRRTDPVGSIPVRIEQGRVMALVAETDGPGEALGLNSSGPAVGTLRGVPALFRDSGPVRLTNLQGAAVAINASEQVVGTVLLPEGGPARSAGRTDR